MRTKGKERKVEQVDRKKTRVTEGGNRSESYRGHGQTKFERRCQTQDIKGMRTKTLVKERKKGILRQKQSRG